LQLGKDTLAAQAKAKDEKSKVLCTVHSGINGPYYGRVTGRSVWEIRERFAAAFEALAIDVSEEVQIYHPKEVSSILPPKLIPGNYRNRWVLMSKERQKWFLELATAYNDVVQDAYLTGFKEGRNLLLGLAEGTTTVDDYNEASKRCGKAQE
jgi:hypothetical protein